MFCLRGAGLEVRGVCCVMALMFSGVTVGSHYELFAEEDV